MLTGAAVAAAAARAHAHRGAVRPKDCRVLAVHTESVTNRQTRVERMMTGAAVHTGAIAPRD